MMFISYQVKFMHISCFITGPADNSFENVNTREYENVRYAVGGEDGERILPVLQMKMANSTGFCMREEN